MQGIYSTLGYHQLKQYVSPKHQLTPVKLHRPNLDALQGYFSMKKAHKNHPPYAHDARVQCPDPEAVACQAGFLQTHTPIHYPLYSTYRPLYISC